MDDDLKALHEKHVKPNSSLNCDDNHVHQSPACIAYHTEAARDMDELINEVRRTRSKLKQISEVASDA